MDWPSAENCGSFGGTIPPMADYGTRNSTKKACRMVFCILQGGPVQKGNRIYNSGFEAGPEGWTPVKWFALDEQVVHSGRFSARLEGSMSRGEPAGIEW